MLILSSMLLLGVLAAVWGFLMCFLPTKWQKLTGWIGSADPSIQVLPKSQNPIIKLIMRIGNSVAGLAICSVGCWFAYFAGSQIYLVLTGRSTIHPISHGRGGLPSSPSPGLTVLAVLVAVAGVLMVVFPGRAIMVFSYIEPSARAVRSSAVPRVTLFVRFFGAALAVLAILSLIH